MAECISHLNSRITALVLMLTFAGSTVVHAQGKDTIKSIKGHKSPASSSKPKPANRPRRTASAPIRRATPRPSVPKTDPSRIVVSRLGQGQFKNIGEAIRSAKPGAKIVVRPGVYEETVNIDKPVEVSSEPGAAEGSTVLESASSSVLKIDSSDCVFRGLSIRGKSNSQNKADFVVEVIKGRPLFQDCDISGGTKACVALRGALADPTLRRCHVFNGGGAGITALSGAKGTFEECDIAANRIGVEIAKGASLVIHGGNIRDNAQEGMRFADGGRGGIDHCDIYGNGGAGVLISSSSDPTFRTCRIHNNAGNGVFVESSGLGRFEGCETYENSGAGMDYSAGGKPTLTNTHVDVFHGAVSYWPMEGGAQDILGGNNGLTVTGATTVKGAFGQALQFDGNSSGIHLRDAENLQFTGSFSISVWVWINSFPKDGNNGQILFRGDDRGGLDPYFLCINQPDVVQFGMTMPKPPFTFVKATIASGRFVHIAAVLDLEAGKMRIYLGGALAGETPATGGPFKTLDSRFAPGLGIGNTQNYGPHNQPFSGIIDELQVYNRALTLMEIQALGYRK